MKTKKQLEYEGLEFWDKVGFLLYGFILGFIAAIFFIFKFFQVTAPVG